MIALETQESGKDAKSEKAEKPIEIPKLKQHRFKNWGSSLHVKGMDDLQRICMKTVRETGDSRAASWFLTALTQPDADHAVYHSSDDHSVTEDGIKWRKTFYYRLPCSAQVAVLLPYVSHLGEQHIAIFVCDALCVDRGILDRELVAFVRDLFHCIED